MARIGRLLAGGWFVLLVACGGGGTSPPSTTSADATSEPAPPTVEVEGDPPTAESIRGIWRHEDQPSRMIRFGPGDAFAVDTHGSIDSSPAVVGTFEIQGSDVVVTVKGVGACDAGDTWTWRAGVPVDGRLNLVFAQTGHGGCAIPVGTEWSFIRLSPASEAGAGITVDQVGELAPLPEDPDEALEALDGLWLLEGTGQLLRLRSYGTYAIDDDGVLGAEAYDSGNVELDGSTLTLVSAVGSDRCSEGDRLVLEDVRIDEIGRSLHGTVVEDACSHGLGAEPVWIRLSL